MGNWFSVPWFPRRNFFVGCQNKIRDPEGSGAFERSGRALFNDLDAVVVGVGYKTGLGTPHKFGGVRLGEAMGAQKY